MMTTMTLFCDNHVWFSSSVLSICFWFLDHILPHIQKWNAVKVDICSSFCFQFALLSQMLGSSYVFFLLCFDVVIFVPLSCLNKILLLPIKKEEEEEEYYQ